MLELDLILLPFFLSAFYWSLLWLLFSLGIGLVIRTGWRAKNVAPIGLKIKQNQWKLTRMTGVYTVVVEQEVLLWSWVIIIPVRETLSGKQHYLVALPDSISQEDWRRLVVWLRTCLS